MKTLENLKKEHAAAVARLEAEHAIAAACPLPPDSVMHFGKRAPWVTFKRTTLAEVLEVMRAFTITPAEVFRYGSTSICPESELSARDRERAISDSGQFACWIDVDQGEGYGPSAKLSFFARLASGALVRIFVEFGAGYIGSCPALGAARHVRRDPRTDRLIESRFEPNLEARSASDKFIKWGTGTVGPIKTAAHFSYLFCSDTQDEAPGAECSHALAQLEILAERAKV